MKKLERVLIVVAVLILTYSCENEPINDPVVNSEQLTFIQEVFTINNQSASTIGFTFDNNQNTKIDYGGSRAEQFFSNGTMNSIQNFDANNVQIGELNFSYNDSKQLTEISISSIENGTTTLQSKLVFEYAANQITSTRTYYTMDGSIDEIDSTNIFTINGANQIIRFDDTGIDAFWEATYADGDLSTILVSGYGNKDGSGNFTHTVNLASDSYQKEKFRFGPEWKNNIMLFNQVGGYSFKQLAELGTHYLSGYTYTSASDSNMQITLSVTYEFDNLNRLTKQTKNKLFFQSAHDHVLTYDYQ
ncbi:hypothetical protein ESY86_05735 [Subsaximicrobium wynnwilliamsii]|uniref:DUF4595 domain-containing protein n=1 Tax=Subsaximicrobium wynnwilliamsii TaxID=291179 RepID=A0A5C6ZJ07_9FLAO|nr:hypothetical protein [Subsaximicrobium wynnwilliamsii]TXD84556.1 hypothetical protein ESY87_05510 [Subsaximicrobium wynnwilliamsii]TXD90238.1 hypothetical protein ESY86_05735 [Subsaximicrobium wynnwilliamsii]TXE04289.1 hypothetical protein ESY88_05505 [Subsaximicrobium wynnwilliamsii]